MKTGGNAFWKIPNPLYDAFAIGAWVPPFTFRSLSRAAPIARKRKARLLVRRFSPDFRKSPQKLPNACIPGLNGNLQVALFDHIFAL